MSKNAAHELFADFTAVLLLSDPHIGKRASSIADQLGLGLGYDMQIRNWDHNLLPHELVFVDQKRHAHIAFAPIQNAIWTAVQNQKIPAERALRILYKALQDEISRWLPESPTSTQELNWEQINARVLENFLNRLRDG